MVYHHVLILFSTTLNVSPDKCKIISHNSKLLNKTIVAFTIHTGIYYIFCKSFTCGNGNTPVFINFLQLYHYSENVRCLNRPTSTRIKKLSVHKV